MQDILLRIIDYIRSLNSFSLILILFLTLVLIVGFVLVLFILFKVLGIKFILYQTKKGEVNFNKQQDQYEFLLEHFYHILDRQTKEQKKFNTNLLSKFEEKTEGFKNVSYKLLELFTNFQKQLLDIKADLQVSKSLEKELKKEIENKNNLIDKYTNGFLATHSKAAAQKLIFTINGILRDSTIEENDKELRIKELEDILFSFNFERIDVKINDELDVKVMRVVETAETNDLSLHNKVSKIISYGYKISEGENTIIDPKTKVQVYTVKQTITGENQ